MPWKHAGRHRRETDFYRWVPEKSGGGGNDGDGCATVIGLLFWLFVICAMCSSCSH